MSKTDPKKQDDVADDLNAADVELVKLALDDAEAFGSIIEKYEPKLMRYLRYFVGGDPQLAEDIFQEAMIKVYRNLNGFNQEMRFSSWIYRITRNEALNHLKKIKRQATVRLNGDDDEGFSLLEVLASEENVVDDTDRRELSGKVREVLEHLRDDYRELLILRFLEDYDYNEISYVLKKPLGTVGVMIGRAKDAFKKLAIKNKLLRYE